MPRISTAALAPRAEEYEFSADQNVPILRLAQKMQFVGVCLAACGILVGLDILRGNVMGPISGGLLVMIGIWTSGAASRFRRIAHTEGKDIHHLMKAIDQLLRMYQLHFITIIVSMCLAAFTLFIVLGEAGR